MAVKHVLGLAGLSVACVGQASTLGDSYRQDPANWPPFEVDEQVKAIELGPLPPLPAVEWHTEAAEDLGKLLFFDPRLSKSGQIACASCHDPNLGWTDGKRFSFGHDRRLGKRNAMTLLNASRFELLFWDGRAEGLVDLALQPIQSPLEMDASIDEVIANLNAIDQYRQEFKNTFDSERIEPELVAIALASFVRSIMSSRSRFDRFADGDTNALNDDEIQGLHLFRTKARCMNCHHGPMLSDGDFHHTGLSYFKRRFEDLGRFHATGLKEDRGKFKTPSLRDLMHTGPWMHNGLFTDFSGILRMYNHGVTFNSRVQKRPGAPPLSPLIKPLGMNRDELEKLELFLNSLSRIPRFVEPPTLPGLAANIDPQPSQASRPVETKKSDVH